LERAEEVLPSEALGRPARSLQRYSPLYHSAVQRPRFAERQLWNSVGILGSLRLDAGRPDHLAPLLGFVCDELPEIGRREREHVATEIGVTASARSLPALIYPIDPTVVGNMTWTCPPSRSLNAGPPPR